MAKSMQPPGAMRTDPDLQWACIGSAVPVDALERMLQAAGFEQIRIELREESRDLIRTRAPERKAERYVLRLHRCGWADLLWRPARKGVRPNND